MKGGHACPEKELGPVVRTLSSSSGRRGVNLWEEGGKPRPKLKKEAEKGIATCFIILPLDAARPHVALSPDYLGQGHSGVFSVV